MSKELNLTLENGDNTIEIRDGKALDIYQPKPMTIEISGDINTVKEFISKRLKAEEALSTRYGGGAFHEDLEGFQRIDPTKAIIVIDYEDMTIELVLDPSHPQSTTVKSKLELNPELVEFGINSGKRWQREDLAKFLKFARRHFFDYVEHDNMVKALKNLSITTTGAIQQNSNDRGVKGAMFDRQVDSSSIPEGFTLNIPIFKNQDKVKFKVEACLDPLTTSVIFWFDSPELEEKIWEGKLEHLDGQVKEFADKFVIIRR